MAQRRKTADERSQERYDAERRAYETFRPKLAALKTFDEAVQLVNQAPPPDTPGRRFYSNLGFFLGEFSVPNGSGHDERSLYLELIRKLDQNGELRPGVRKRLETTFESHL